MTSQNKLIVINPAIRQYEYVKLFSLTPEAVRLNASFHRLSIKNSGANKTMSNNISCNPLNVPFGFPQLLRQITKKILVGKLPPEYVLVFVAEYLEKELERRDDLERLNYGDGGGGGCGRQGRSVRRLGKPRGRQAAPTVLVGDYYDDDEKDSLDTFRRRSVPVKPLRGREQSVDVDRRLMTIERQLNVLRRNRASEKEMAILRAEFDSMLARCDDLDADMAALRAKVGDDDDDNDTSRFADRGRRDICVASRRHKVGGEVRRDVFVPDNDADVVIRLRRRKRRPGDRRRASNTEDGSTGSRMLLEARRSFFDRHMSLIEKKFSQSGTRQPRLADVPWKNSSSCVVDDDENLLMIIEPDFSASLSRLLCRRWMSYDRSQMEPTKVTSCGRTADGCGGGACMASHDGVASIVESKSRQPTSTKTPGKLSSVPSVDRCNDEVLKNDLLRRQTTGDRSGMKDAKKDTSEEKSSPMYLGREVHNIFEKICASRRSAMTDSRHSPSKYSTFTTCVDGIDEVPMSACLAENESEVLELLCGRTSATRGSLAPEKKFEDLQRQIEADQRRTSGGSDVQLRGPRRSSERRKVSMGTIEKAANHEASAADR